MQLENAGSKGVGEACAALFVSNSDPNLISNCYWSSCEAIDLDVLNAPS